MHELALSWVSASYTNTNFILVSVRVPTHQQKQSAGARVWHSKRCIAAIEVFIRLNNDNGMNEDYADFLHAI